MTEQVVPDISKRNKEESVFSKWLELQDEIYPLDYAELYNTVEGAYVKKTENVDDEPDDEVAEDSDDDEKGKKGNKKGQNNNKKKIIKTGYDKRRIATRNATNNRKKGRTTRITNKGTKTRIATNRTKRRKNIKCWITFTNFKGILQGAIK